MYALTYGMMLGIRVLTGRSELYHYGKDTDEDNSDDNLRDLTEADYDYELELVFPPEGSAKSTGQVGSGIYATPPHKLNHPFKFKDYMANVFRAVRSISGIDEKEYIKSIAGKSIFN